MIDFLIPDPGLIKLTIVNLILLRKLRSLKAADPDPKTAAIIFVFKFGVTSLLVM